MHAIFERKRNGRLTRQAEEKPSTENADHPKQVGNHPDDENGMAPEHHSPSYSVEHPTRLDGRNMSR